ncbi:metallophosphoesterase family protein [Paenibacillus sp. KN14-4R]|uniref:metallophosphoesterase family protein n=1 Tax=Paenibacillus sp. KN14-4R TaxID=3445773 RepID=UPI003FA0C4CB
MLQKLRCLIAVILVCMGISSNARFANASTGPMEFRDDTPAGDRVANLTFWLISDLHVTSPIAVDKCTQALRDLQVAAPDAKALVVNGDLGDGHPSNYASFNKIMQTVPHPSQVMYTIGNHEFYQAWYNRRGDWSRWTFPNEETDQMSIARFLQFTGEKRVYQDRWIQGYHFIMLGSEKYRSTDESNLEDAYLSSEQLKWLEEKLKEKESKRTPMNQVHPIFVFLHQPLPDSVAGSGSTTYNRGVVQYKQLRAILERYPNVILFSGHTHSELGEIGTIVRKRFTMVNSSSVWEPLTKDNLSQSAKGQASEGLVVQVYGDHVRVRGRDFQHGRWLRSVDEKVFSDNKKRMKQ